MPTTGYVRRARRKQATQPTMSSFCMLFLLERDQVDGDRPLVVDLREGLLRDLDSVVGQLDLELGGESEAGRFAPVRFLDQLQRDLPQDHVDLDRLFDAVHREVALDGPVLVVLLREL